MLSTTINIQPDNLAPVPYKRPEKAKVKRKRIDYILGLKLTNEEKKKLNQRSAFVDSKFQSVNQGCNKSINNCPNFLDVEVKKMDSRDAKVQLAVWTAAGYKKKRFHGWSTELPMLALGIQNHEWRLHIGACFQQDLVSKKCCLILPYFTN